MSSSNPNSLDDPKYNEIPEIPEKDKAGTCGFCGTGDGWLGEQGDETTQHLHGSVRTGEPGNYEYKSHPNSTEYSIVWCGSCYRGLKHKYQRYDDTNLRAVFLSTKLRLELDGLRWVGWEADTKEREHVKKYLDDPAIHLEKLRAESDLRDMQEEQFRRYGHPPRDGWII